MPGPQDRWDRHEDPPDSTMDLPRVTDPYPASGPDNNHPPHGQLQRSHVPAERPSEDRDLQMSPRRGPMPSAGNPLERAQLGPARRNDAPRDAPQLDEAPLYRAALEKARRERTRPESAPLGRPPPGRAPHGDVHRDPAPHDRPSRDGPPSGDAPPNGRPRASIPLNDGPRYPVPVPSRPAEFPPAAAEIPPPTDRPAELLPAAARPAELPAAAAPPAGFPHAGATPPEARPGDAQPERITPDRVQHDEPPGHAASGNGGQARDELPEDRRQAENRPAPRDRPMRAWDGERPARGSVDELRLRLERLPTGHPSSPYNDDGTRKPPVAQLRQLELPLLGEERPADAGGNRSHPAPRTALPPAGRSGADGPGRGTDHTEDDSFGGAADHREPADHRELAGHREPESNGRAAGDIGPDHAGVSDPYQRTWPTGQDVHEPRARAEGSRNLTGRHLTPQQRKIADQALTKCRVAEGRNVFGSYGESGLTPAMRRTEAQLEHGRLAPDTELYTLKSADRFKEKLARLITRFPDSDPESLTSDVHDGIRYTFLFDEPHYVDGVAQASDSLERAGYELVELRPSWASGEYKGISSRWRDSAGLSFEVQWHTPESWDAKQKTQAACERIADPSTPIEEVEQLRAYQRALSADVPIPPGAMLMRRYKKES